MTKGEQYIPVFLVVAVTLMVVAIIHVLLWHELPVSNKEIVYTSLGIILGKFGSTYDYFFGSSSGSAKKTDAMIDSKKDESSVTTETKVTEKTTVNPPEVKP